MGASFHVRSPMQALVVSVRTEVGQAVAAGQTLVILEAMKMEHIVTAEQSGIVTRILAKPDAMVAEGDPLVLLKRAEHVETATDADEETSLDDIRPDLAEVRERHAFGLDENRPDAVAKRRKTGQRTARENIADLVDEGTLVEYGALVIAAQRRRRPIEDLIQRTPADGMVAGIGRVNGELFGDTGTQCAVSRREAVDAQATRTTPSLQASIAAPFNTSPSFPERCR